MKSRAFFDCFVQEIITWEYLPLFFILPFFAVFLFYYKIQTPFPNIPAGLYALMGETIAKNHFILPETIPYYGPGGIPFAYPPLSFYLMAFSGVVFRVDSFDYLRLAPSLFLLCSLVPMYMLTKAMTDSPRQAAIATVLFGTSVGVVINHYYSPGICRGVALLFMLICLYFAYGTFYKRKKGFAILTSFFLALTVLTHLSYAVFGVISIIVFGLFSDKMTFWKRFLIGMLIGLGSLVISSPWWITVIARHGASVFVNALLTHDNTSIIYIFNAFPTRMVDLLNSLVFYRYENPILVGGAMLGIALSIPTKKYLLPAWLLFSVFGLGGDGQRFIAIINSLLGAFAIDYILSYLPELSWTKIKIAWRNWIIFGILSILTATSIWCAFIIRSGKMIFDYKEVILTFICISVVMKFLVYFAFDIFHRKGDIPLFGKKDLRRIFIAVTVSSVIVSAFMFLLFALKIIALRVPYSVLILDWVISLFFIYSFYGIFYKFYSDDTKYIPSIIFIILLTIGIYLSRPTLFNIDFAASEYFMHNVMDLSTWTRNNTPSESTFLMVSEDNSYQLPGILRYDDEWFPYLLARTPVVCPYGAEWTQGYAQQQDLLAEIHRCSEKQSWECLKLFMEKNKIQPDFLIIHLHSEPYSIYAKISNDSDWNLVYRNDEYSIWQMQDK